MDLSSKIFPLPTLDQLAIIAIFRPTFFLLSGSAVLSLCDISPEDLPFFSQGLLRFFSAFVTRFCAFRQRQVFFFCLHLATPEVEGRSIVRSVDFQLADAKIRSFYGVVCCLHD